MTKHKLPVAIIFDSSDSRDRISFRCRLANNHKSSFNFRMSQNGPALLLTGGGAKASYQAGALKALGEILPQTQSPFRVICGCSAGAINAAAIGSKADNWLEATKWLHQIWWNLELKDVYLTNGFSLGKNALAWISRTAFGGKGGTREIANHLLDTKPLSELLAREINFENLHRCIESGVLQGMSISALQYFEQTSISFFEARTDIQNWERSGRRAVRTRLQAEHVMASSAMPVLFPPICIEDQYYGDGNLRLGSPLSPAIHLGADRILCIGLRPIRKTSKAVDPSLKRQSPALAEILGEVLNTVFLDALDADIERLQRINEAIKRAPHEVRDQQFPRLRQIPVFQLTPSRNLDEVIPSLSHQFPPILRYLLNGLGTSDKKDQGQELLAYLAFFAECVHPLLNLGYEDTLKRREEILEFMK